MRREFGRNDAVLGAGVEGWENWSRENKSRKQRGDDSQKVNSNGRGRGWEMVCVPLFDKNAKDGAPGHLRWFNEFQFSRCFIIYGAKPPHDVMTLRKLLLPRLLRPLSAKL